jgi:hypothetical protein
MCAVPEFCAPFMMRDTCQGRCKVAGQVCYGSLDAEDPILCRKRDIAIPLDAVRRCSSLFAISAQLARPITQLFCSLGRHLPLLFH